MAEETLLVYATANLRTEIREIGGGYRWLHSSGWQNPNNLPEPPAYVHRAVSTINVPRARFVLPTYTDGVLAFDLPGPVSLGWRLLSGAVEPSSAVDALRAVGSALHALHRSVPEELGPVPRLAGLRRWLADGDGPQDAPFLHTVVAEALGDRRMADLLTWCEDLVAQGPRARLVHGGMSLNHVVIDPESEQAHIPIGLGVGAGSPVIDLARIVAEVPAYRQVGALVGRSELDLRALTEAFLDGYGTSVDDVELAKAVAVTTVLGLHSIAAHIGWKELIHGRVDELAQLVDGALR
ncbi:hypothetical protein [Actinokineospora sp. UTMC 2448]|uniref:hypothetical protein n=1 Tax=Actinokineospora sp. UTMC 2448 TaxID=2268449 RepID=UPI00216470E2|nr:hypothetical protein [Actinokineospora sp. UTMC 2448]UVS81382.1 hypothetical protein Actkin_05139 [Actinokineospora sp. UTMC 2448]